VIRWILASLAVLLAGAATSPAATWRATSDADLQDTVDGAAYGDTVWVAPGEYLRVVLRSGIRLLAEEGPETTVIRNGRFWVVKADEVDSLTTVAGFLLDGVKAAEGVVYAENSQLAVRDCHIRGGWSGVRAMFSDMQVRACVITDCQNAAYFYECGGVIEGCEITRCMNGISLVSATTRIQRNEIHGNSLGISVSKHSDPTIGGAISAANRIWDNQGGGVKNESLQKKYELRTMKPATLHVPYNWWGSDCPDSSDFRGPVVWAPWVAGDGTRSLEECPRGTSSE
jgi:hypothetical protein